MNNFTWSMVFIGYTFLWVAIYLNAQRRYLQSMNKMLDRLMARDYREYKHDPSKSGEVRNSLKKKLNP